MMIASLRHTLTARRTAAGVSLRALERFGPGLDRSGFARFESGDSLPRDLDGAVLAYARALGVEPQGLWAEALALFADDPDGTLATTALRGRRALADLEGKGSAAP